MEFINPAALWGVALVAVPLLIHLVTRRRAVPKRFAAMRFVLLSHRNLKRKLRLKRILILLARVLAVAALALLVAHPTLPADERNVKMGKAPRSLVIIVDNSMSMTAGEPGERPWDRARAMARSIAESMAAGQEAALVVTNPGEGDRPPSFTADPDALRRQAEKLNVSHVYAPVTDSISRAVSLMGSAHHPLRQVLLITDLQRSAWTGEVTSALPGVKLVVMDAGDKEPMDNAAVADVTLEPSIGEARYDATVRVAAFAGRAVPGLEVSIMVGDRAVARGFLDLPAEGISGKRMSFSAEGKGILRARAQIAPDALDIDNRYYFTARAGGRIKALVVDGDPRAERYGAESYYIMNALNPKLEARSRIDPTLIAPPGLEETKLDDYDLVITANVGNISRKARDKLKRYVSGGGALFISLGSNTAVGEFSSDYGELAPARLYILKEPAQPAHIRGEGLEHPAVSLFTGSESADLSLARFDKYYMLDLSGARGEKPKVVLSFRDGSPALVEKPLGRGRVALWTSTLDRDWNDLCIYPAYLPLLQQMAQYLTGGMADPGGTNYTVGETARFTCPPESASAWIIPPGAGPERVELTPSADEKLGEITLTEGPGFYEVYCSATLRPSSLADKRPDRLLAANSDVRESNLAKWKPESLEKHLERMGFEKPRVITDLSGLAGNGGFEPGRRDASWLLLTALAALLVIEGFLTRKG